MQSYDLLVERMVKASGLQKEEIERRIEAKKAKLSGLISREGAAQIVSAELGINLEDQDLKINELMPGMKKANLFGKIVSMFPVREYDKAGKKGKVVNFIIADDTGNIRVVLWDTNHISLIESGKIRLNDFVEIKNATMRDQELHLSGFSGIKKSDKTISNIKTEKVSSRKEINELNAGQNVLIRGVVVQMFNPRFFSVCPECGKKVNQEAKGFVCIEHGKVAGKERAILNFVLDDGTETIRVVLFSDQISKLTNESDLKDVEKLGVFREDLMGSELVITGNVRKNQLFNNLEVIGTDIGKADVDKLIEELEKS